MKKYFLLAIVPILFVSCEKETILPDHDIPAKISAFISTHFPENTVIQAIKDKDGQELTFDIMLENGFFLEFNRKEVVIDIEGSSKLPDSVIPGKLLEYATTNFAGNYIVGWELDDRNQQIELNNNLKLEFNMNGEFLRIDK